MSEKQVGNLQRYIQHLQHRIADELHLFDQSQGALDRLQDAWAQYVLAAREKSTAGQRQSETKASLDFAENEAFFEAQVEGILDGKNAKDREKQLAVHLDKLADNEAHPYAVAFAEHREAQRIYEQANLEETIAAETLSTAKARCRLLEAMLNAISA